MSRGSSTCFIWRFKLSLIKVLICQWSYFYFPLILLRSSHWAPFLTSAGEVRASPSSSAPPALVLYHVVRFRTLETKPCEVAASALAKGLMMLTVATPHRGAFEGRRALALQRIQNQDLGEGVLAARRNSERPKVQGRA